MRENLPPGWHGAVAGGLVALAAAGFGGCAPGRSGEGGVAPAGAERAAGGRRAAGAGASVAFRLEDARFIPEGVAYDPASRSFFVGSTYERKIVRVAEGRPAVDFTAPMQDGLLGVVGMKVDAERGTLWAVSSHAGVNMPMATMGDQPEGSSAVHVYDVRSGRLLRRYRLAATPSPHFLNDLAIDQRGDAWVTDTVEGALYRAPLEGGALERAVEFGDLGPPNGIALPPDGRAAFVAVPEGFVRVDLAARSARRLELSAGVDVVGADGLAYADGALVAVEPWRKGAEVSLYRLSPDGARVLSRETLLGGHPELEQPTTGVVVGRDVYVIANSHLQTFRRAFVAGAPERAPLRGAAVLRVPLP
jgi:sugar lactone lactonase YvrE